MRLVAGSASSASMRGERAERADAARRGRGRRRRCRARRRRPGAAIRHDTSCSPVPEAETMPMSPRGTRWRRRAACRRSAQCRSPAPSAAGPCRCAEALERAARPRAARCRENTSDVQARRRAPCAPQRGEFARHRDQREVGPRQALERAGERARARARAAAPARRRPAKQDLSLGERRLAGLAVCRPHRDDQVVRRRPARPRPRAARRRAAAPGSTACRSSARRSSTPGQRRERARDAHQRDRVEVAAALDAVNDERSRRPQLAQEPALSRSRRAARARRRRRPGRRPARGARCRC